MRPAIQRLAFIIMSYLFPISFYMYKSCKYFPTAVINLC